MALTILCVSFTLLLLLVWELAVRAFHIPEFVLPTPTRIAETTWQFRQHLMLHAWQTLMTTLVGFFFAIVVGILLGVAIGSSSAVYDSLYPLLIGPADFDATKFGYLGSVATDVSLCISWHQSPIQSWKDVVAKEYRAGGEGRGSEPDVFATVLQKVFDTKTKLITGYPGTAEMTLAMQRGEIDGLCGISYSTIQSIHSDWLQNGQVKILVQSAAKKHPAIPDVPLITDLTKDPRKSAILDLIVAPQEMARPFVAPPGLPPERLQALRDAFDATMKDPEFLAEMKKSKLDVDPVSGKSIQELVTRLWASPKDVIEAAAAASGAEPTKK